nr:major facilitator superfamily MFS-1 protein [Theileria orientalis]
MNLCCVWGSLEDDYNLGLRLTGRGRFTFTGTGMAITLSADSHSNEKSCKETVLKSYQKPGFVFSYINVANLLQFIHMQFLTSSMLGLEKDMGFSPKKISVFVVVEQVTLLVFVPVWGIISDHFELKYILIVSIASSGFIVMILSFLREFFSMVIFRFLNGIMIGSALPVSQKYVVLAEEPNAGYAFGVMHAVCNLGRLICSIVVTTLSTNKYFDVYGWRICSFVLGVLCLISIPLLFLIPQLKTKNYRSLKDIIDSCADSKAKYKVATIWNRFMATATVRTVILLTLLTFFSQGVYTSATFLTIYLQYCKLSNFWAGITTGVVIIGSATGGILGGILADYLHRRFPKYGRLSMGVFCCSLRLVLLTSLLFGITFDNILKRYAIFVIGLLFLGSTFSSISFVDRSVLLNVVMPSEQSFGIASVLTVAGVPSAFVFPSLMGFFVKDVFGYQETIMEIKEMPYHMLRKNAFALRDGIACLCIFSTISTIIFYFTMFPTYYKDSKAVQDKVEAEMKLTQVEVVKEPAYKRTLSRLDTN